MFWGMAGCGCGGSLVMSTRTLATCESIYLYLLCGWGCMCIYLWGAVRAVGVFTCGVLGLVGVPLGL